MVAQQGTSHQFARGNYGMDGGYGGSGVEGPRKRFSHQAPKHIISWSEKRKGVCVCWVVFGAIVRRAIGIAAEREKRAHRPLPFPGDLQG